MPESHMLYIIIFLNKVEPLSNLWYDYTLIRDMLDACLTYSLYTHQQVWQVPQC